MLRVGNSQPDYKEVESQINLYVYLNDYTICLNDCTSELNLALTGSHRLCLILALRRVSREQCGEQLTLCMAWRAWDPVLFRMVLYVY